MAILFFQYLAVYNNDTRLNILIQQNLQKQIKKFDKCKINQQKYLNTLKVAKFRQIWSCWPWYKREEVQIRESFTWDVKVFAHF